MLPAGDAVDDPGQVNQRQREPADLEMQLQRDVPQQRVPQRAAELRKHQHRPAADAVADHPQHRCGHELAGREDGEKITITSEHVVALIAPKNGSCGRMMPNPIRSMKTMNSTIQRASARGRGGWRFVFGHPAVL